MIFKRLSFFTAFIFIIVWGSTIFSCKETNSVPDISDIHPDWDFIPFHKDQAEIEDVSTFINSSIDAYPDFGQLFFTQVLPVLELSSEERIEIINDPGFISLIDTCALIYNDVKELEEEFERAFKYYQHYTGDTSLPNLYTFVSGFAYQNFVFRDGQKDGIGIGLDMFLGSEFPYKSIDPKNPAFSQFLTQYFDKKYLVRKTLLAWIDDKIPTAQSAQLIEMMIRNGKILYILEKLLPQTPKDIILEIQPDQYQWCLKNEPELWTFLLKNDLLYSTDFTRINKLVNPAPNVPGMPEEAPGGVANYVGWRIVQDFMEREDYSLNELISMTDYQQIMDQSKYRPRMRKE